MRTAGAPLGTNHTSTNHPHFSLNFQTSTIPSPGDSRSGAGGLFLRLRERQILPRIPGRRIRQYLADELAQATLGRVLIRGRLADSHLPGLSEARGLLAHSCHRGLEDLELPCFRAPWPLLKRSDVYPKIFVLGFKDDKSFSGDRSRGRYFQVRVQVLLELSRVPSFKR
jgi:hypothetical protein